jgi:hypothetical protein
LKEGEFLQVFLQILHDAKRKETRKNEVEKGSNLQAPNKPSSECRDFLVDFLEIFYEAESSMALERKHIPYGEKNISKFQMEMR